jgi:hypothetical protein
LKGHIYLGDEAFMSSMQRKIGKEKADLKYSQSKNALWHRLWPR